MKFYTNLTKTEFNEFALQCPYHHYLKTAEFGEFKTRDGFEYWLCGVKEDGKVVATALLQRKKLNYLYGSFAYVPYGYNVDYDNHELLKFLSESLIEFVRSLKVTFFRIDPNVQRLEHDKNGQVIPDGFNHEYITADLVSFGFQHLGYRYGYSGNWLSRFTYILDLTPALTDIYQGIKRYRINASKNELRQLEVSEVGLAGIEALHHYQLDLAKQEGFKPKPLAYFQAMYQAFYPNVRLYQVKVNFKACLVQLEQEIENLKQAINKPELKKGLAKEYQLTIASLEKEIAWLKDNGYAEVEELVLGAKFIIISGQKAFNVYMYTLKLTSNFKIAWALHQQAITDLKGLGIKSYDFEGISGATNKDDLYYGLHEFKKSFGGDYIEYLGEFDYLYQSNRYRLYRKLDVLVSRVIRKLKRLLTR